MWNKQKIEAIWCIDAKTSRQFLVDLNTHNILAEKVDGKLIDPSLMAPLGDEIPNEGC